MVYTPLTNKAMQIAYRAHHGQTDKSGIPYVFHPYHLAEQMSDEYTVCTALLHDVVEDTDVTLAELAEIFPKEVVEAVALLTHSEGTDYFEYVTAIKGNPIAKAVKLADLTHNSNEQRLNGIHVSAESIESRSEKYRKARKILEG